MTDILDVEFLGRNNNDQWEFDVTIGFTVHTLQRDHISLIVADSKDAAETPTSASAETWTVNVPDDVGESKHGIYAPAEYSPPFYFALDLGETSGEDGADTKPVRVTLEDESSSGGTTGGRREVTLDNSDVITVPIDEGTNQIIQRPTVTVQVGAEEFSPVEIDISTNRFTTAARADVSAVLEEVMPRQGQALRIDINGVRAFTGSVESSQDQGDGSVSFHAFDLVKKLFRTPINATFDSATLRTVVQEVTNAIGTSAFIDVPLDTRVSPEYNNTPATKVLNQVTKWGDVLWWVDRRNFLHVEPPNPTTHAFGPAFIETGGDAGEKEIPYSRVIVVGGQAASESTSGDSPGGEQAAHMLSKYSISASAGTGEPVFRYQSKQIRTSTQAQRVANAVLKAFMRQRAQGTVGVVGEGIPVRPLDVIEMPDKLNNERYLVNSIKHTFNNEDGLVTDVDCGGLIDVELSSEIRGPSPYQ